MRTRCKIRASLLCLLSERVFDAFEKNYKALNDGLSGEISVIDDLDCVK